MASIMELMQLCRLCLVKDQANVPIFQEQGDIRQIFLKITACLPIKVSKDDSLPKKICDGCLYKLELLYQFWNTTANAEKQLLTWLSQAGIEGDSKTTQEAVAIALQSQISTHSVKEEELDPPESIPESTDDLTTEAESFILQPPQLPFEPAGTQFEGPPGFSESQGESRLEDDGEAGSDEDDEDTGAMNEDEQEEEPEEEDDPEPPPPKRSRRQAAIKAAQLVSQKVEDEEEEEEDEEDADDPTVTVPKTEEESENSETEDNSENPPPTDFVSLGTAGDEDQPGPSGVGKTEAPSSAEHSPSCSRNEKSFECNICDYKGGTLVYLTKHMLKHTDERPLKCYVCFKSIKAANLTKHLMIHTGEKPLQCNICDYKCRQVQYLKSHMLTHTGEMPFECKLCDYKCALRRKWNRHLLTHSDEKQFLCNFCDHKFTERGSLNRHLLTHTGEKPFKCNVCDYKCAESGNLKKHLVKHTGEKPFKCDLCSYRCSRSGLLKSHMLRHTGEKPFKCNVCDYTCIEAGRLKKHLQKHIDEKPLKCIMCDHKFDVIGDLETHLLAHAGENTLKCDTEINLHAAEKSRKPSPAGKIRKNPSKHVSKKPTKSEICSGMTVHKRMATQIVTNKSPTDTSLEPKVNTIDDTQSYHCHYCGYRCSQVEMYIEHLELSHSFVY